MAFDDQRANGPLFHPFFFELECVSSCSFLFGPKGGPPSCLFGWALKPSGIGPGKKSLNSSSRLQLVTCCGGRRKFCHIFLGPQNLAYTDQNGTLPFCCLKRLLIILPKDKKKKKKLTNSFFITFRLRVWDFL